jgi:hypothetical protein
MKNQNFFMRPVGFRFALRDIAALLVLHAVAVAGAIDLFALLTISDAPRIQHSFTTGLGVIARSPPTLSVRPKATRSYVYVGEYPLTERWFHRFTVAIVYASAAILLSFVAASLLLARTSERTRWFGPRLASSLACFVFLVVLFFWAYSLNPDTHTVSNSGYAVHVMVPAGLRVLALVGVAACMIAVVELAGFAITRRHARNATKQMQSSMIVGEFLQD